MIHPGKPVWLFDLDNTLHDANPHISTRTGFPTSPAWVDLRLKSVLELPRHLGALG